MRYIVRGREANVLDCKPSCQSSTLGRGRLRIFQFCQHMRTLVVCTARTQIVAHVKDPTSTDLSIGKGPTDGGMETNR